MNTAARVIFSVRLLTFLALIALPGIGFAQDVTPPNINALSFTPTSINTSAGPATVTVNFTLADTGTGVLYFESAFVDPSNTFAQRAFKLFSPPKNSVTD